jgi:hypothetical protein
MKWTIGGPDLPPELLHSVEDGRLVFFCGAGVSYPAGLPGFRGLVEDVYRRTNQAKADLEQAEFDRVNFDRVLGLLENRIGSTIVRRAVVDALSLDATADLGTHRSLLALATNRDGVCRLVTTNFDRGFEFVAGSDAVIDSAPRLPVPKVGVWNSIVHLHGRICDADPEGRSLVMTSADFGSAYLTERWASRFLSDLFRRFAVLFVGYSVEDPVVRYMMDAFAADRALGEGVGKAFVLAGCADGDEDKDARAWQAKGVIPLLYDSRDNHAALHQTLNRWAECHSRGLLGKESIVQEHANKIPTKPFDQDPVVSQVVWALREDSGHVASVFARLDPVPPVEWLDVLQEQGLLALPCAPGAASDDRGWRVPLADGGGRTAFAPGLNPISRALGDWITRHLDRTEVIDWALRSGSVLHPEFRWIIRRRLAEKPEMPAALRQIWKVLGSEAALIRSNVHSFSLDLHEPLTSGEWDFQLRHGVVDALSPVLELRPSVHRVIFPEDLRDDEAISHFAEVEVVPKCKDSARLLIDAIARSPIKQQVLSDLADHATSLLNGVMQLYEMMQKAGPLSDWSYSDQPSISPHAQNASLHDWTLLLEFCRDTWTTLLGEDSVRARRLVERWRTLPYPVFRRLCFFAMTESDLYSPADCLACVLEDDGWWLWSIYVYREKFRLLGSIWPTLGEEGTAELMARILSGPPRSMFRDDVSEEDFERIASREMWLHLSKLQRAGRALPDLGNAKLIELSARYPEWRLDDEDRSEFAVWMDGGFGEPPLENQDEFVNLTDDVVIGRLSEGELRRGDLARWRHLISVDPARASALLAAMAQANVWKDKIWHAALESFGVQKQTVQQWPTLAPILMNAPDPLLDEIRVPLSWCLKELAEAPDAESRLRFWDVWDRLQPHAFRDAPEDVADMLTAALNTPSGHLTQALLDCMASTRPQRASDLSDDMWQRLTLLTTGDGQSFKLARVLLASRLAWLHGLNPTWVEEHFLPYFDWNQSPEAPAVWHGYLWQARITPELWPRIKDSFIAALREKTRLGRSGDQICQLFGAICVNRPEWLTPEETQAALRSLDAKGRATVARVVWKRLEGAGAQSETLWREMVAPWLDRVWPKDLALRDPESSLNLAMAATHAGGAFAAAVNAIAPLLVGAEHHSLLVERLLELNMATREPGAVIQLIGLAVDTEWQWPDPKLRDLLNQIQSADAAFAALPSFRSLDEYLRRHNM